MGARAHARAATRRSWSTTARPTARARWRRALGARVVREPRRGFGAACCAGLQRRHGDVVCFMDCDGSLDPRELPRVAGPGGGRPRRPRARRAARPSRARGRCTPGWPTAVLAWRAAAPQRRARCATSARCAPRRREALLALGLRDRRFGWPLEMVLRAGRAGWRIEEVEVGYRPRAGRSKVTGTVRGTVRAVRDMAAVLRDRASDRDPPAHPVHGPVARDRQGARSPGASRRACARRARRRGRGARARRAARHARGAAARGHGRPPRPRARRRAGPLAAARLRRRPQRGRRAGGAARARVRRRRRPGAADRHGHAAGHAARCWTRGSRALATTRRPFGPAADGGYWAIGLREPDPRVFDGVPMSRAGPARPSAPAGRARPRSARLPALRDVDTVADARVVAALAPRGAFAAAWRELAPLLARRGAGGEAVA